MIKVNSIKLVDRPIYITDDNGQIVQDKPEYYLISYHKISKSLKDCSEPAIINQDTILFITPTILHVSMKYITVQDLNTTIYLYPIVDILQRIDDELLALEASNTSDKPITKNEFDFNDIITFNISYIYLGTTGIYCVESVEELYNKKLNINYV